MFMDPNCAPNQRLPLSTGVILFPLIEFSMYIIFLSRQLLVFHTARMAELAYNQMFVSAHPGIKAQRAKNVSEVGLDTLILHSFLHMKNGMKFVLQTTA